MIEYNFCASACVIDKQNKKVLFIHHKKLNKWLLVGGHIENNEDPETAVLREIKEETNLDCELIGRRYPKQNDFITPLALQRNVIREDHIHIDIFFIAIAKNIEQIKEQKEEILAYKWLSKEEILNSNLDTFPDKKVLALDALDIVFNH